MSNYTDDDVAAAMTAIMVTTHMPDDYPRPQVIAVLDAVAPALWHRWLTDLADESVAGALPLNLADCHAVSSWLRERAGALE